MSENVTIVEVKEPHSFSSDLITIKPFVDNTIDNMGLQKYDQVLFDGVWHEEQLACLETNGIIRYVTGLDEFAPSVKRIPDESKRNARIRQIRSTVAQLEKELASNVISPDDPEFWNKVKVLRPDNTDFWRKVMLKCGNEPVYLNPSNPHDLIKIKAIEEGGFSIVASSFEEAKRSGGKKKFYLDRAEETISHKTEVKKVKARAMAKLIDLFDSNPTKLKYIAKVIDSNSAQYKNTTPNDVIFDVMEKYISGMGVERSPLKASKMFLEQASKELGDLKIHAVVRDAVYHKICYTKSDGFIYYKPTGTILGRTVDDVIEFLKDPINDKITGDLTDNVERRWGR